MKKFLEILGIIIGLIIIVVELIRLFNGISYKYSDLSVSKQVIKDVRDVVRESDVQNYVKATELAMIGEIEQLQDDTYYNIKDYNIRVSSTNPSAGIFIMNGDSVKEGLYRYNIENVGQYYTCYNQGKVSISRTLRQLKNCDDLKEEMKNQ